MSLLDRGSAFCDGIARRGFLKAGVLGLGGLALPDILRARALAAKQDRQYGRDQRQAPREDLGHLHRAGRRAVAVRDLRPQTPGPGRVSRGLQRHRHPSAGRVLQPAHGRASQDRRPADGAAIDPSRQQQPRSLQPSDADRLLQVGTKGRTQRDALLRRGGGALSWTESSGGAGLRRSAADHAQRRRGTVGSGLRTVSDHRRSQQPRLPGAQSVAHQGTDRGTIERAARAVVARSTRSGV